MRHLPIDELKARYPIARAWQDEGLPGEPNRICRSPFPDSHKNGDATPSFSVYENGQRWKDFATDEGGDVIDFLRKAHGGTVIEAMDLIRERLGEPAFDPTLAAKARQAPAQRAPAPVAREPRKVPARPMPPDTGREWRDGNSWLRLDRASQIACDTWRGWPFGTTAAVAGLGLMAYPELRGSGRPRSWAFLVQSPRKGGWEGVGFHARHVSPSGGRAYWEFKPKGTQALPFVLGHFSGARLIVVAEGQWDAITFAAAAGWLAHERAWREWATVVGVRGATSWRGFVDAYTRHWPAAARVLVLPDGDEAGARWWQGEAPFVRAMANLSARVAVLPIEAGSTEKDFNELHKAKPFSEDGIRDLIVHAGLMNAKGEIV